MSDRDFLDLDEDLQDDGPDTPVGEWDDLMEDFPADDPAAANRLAVRPAAPTTVSSSAESPLKTKPKKARRPRRRAGGPSTGVICVCLMLLAAVTLAAGLLTAVGGAPESLLDFSGFSDPARMGDFVAHPVNAFWLAAAVTLLAAVLTGVAVSRRVSGLSASSSDQDEILEAIRHLDPEKPETWDREELQSDPDLAAATGALLGHYNLQQAKLQRYVGLEGELHRLEKAMADESQEDLQGTWENPAAGSLADQALRLLQLREELSRDASKNRDALSQQGPDLVAGLRDARSWQAAGLDQVKHQGSGIERIFRRLGKLAEAVPAADDLAPRRERLRQAIEAVRQELESLPSRSSDSEKGGEGSLGTLVERASRLAFQIAMEVARLGAKGERLLPLTQDLEELTTELRATMDRDRGKPGHNDDRDRVLQNVRGRLAELDPAVLETAGDGAAATAVAELAPAAGEVAAGLANLTKNFAVQERRLREMVELASALTGIQAADGGDPDAEPGTGMLVEQFDPFAGRPGADGGLMADPFAASSERSIFETDAAPSDDFARTVLPGQEETLLGPRAPAAEAVPEPEADLGLLTNDNMVLGDTPEPPPPVAEQPAATPPAATPPAAPPVTAQSAAPPPTPVPAPIPAPTELSLEGAGDPLGPLSLESPLPSDDEKVYDLSEFDALPLEDGQPAAGTADERIHELSEFGAVKIE